MRIPTRLQRAAMLGVTAALTIGSALPAQAVPSGDNVLRGFCAATVTTSCVSVMDNDEGDLRVIDRHGSTIGFGSSRAALTWFRHHGVKKCKQEDSPSCYWDAGRRGNRVGASFIDIGGKALFYLGNLD